jgi:hypothetical protein
VTYDETEIVADAALQLGSLRDALSDGAQLGDGQLRLVQLGIQKVIGLLGALPIDSEGEAA